MTMNKTVLSREVKISHCKGNVDLWFLYYNHGFRLTLFYDYSLTLRTRKVCKKKRRVKEIGLEAIN
jgi:hypothetical protein